MSMYECVSVCMCGVCERAFLCLCLVSASCAVPYVHHFSFVCLFVCLFDIDSHLSGTGQWPSRLGWLAFESQDLPISTFPPLRL